MRPFIDPHDGDIEDDAASTKQRSLLSLFGSVLAEISLPKLVLVWLALVVIPAILVGLAPIGISLWLDAISTRVLSPAYAIVPTLLLLLLLALHGLDAAPSSVWQKAASGRCSRWSSNPSTLCFAKGCAMSCPACFRPGPTPLHA